LTPIIQLISAIGTIIASVAFATWVLSNKISSTRFEIINEIASLKTDLAVLKKSEELRDEKINKMWEWWLTFLERGARDSMKNSGNN
jgi:hypothetical protein